MFLINTTKGFGATTNTIKIMWNSCDAQEVCQSPGLSEPKFYYMTQQHARDWKPGPNLDLAAQIRHEAKALRIAIYCNKERINFGTEADTDVFRPGDAVRSQMTKRA